MAWFVGEWTVFTFIALAMQVTGYAYTKKPNEQMLLYGGAFLFWIGSIGQWVIDHAGSGSLLLGVTVLIAPWMASFAWFMQALAEQVDQARAGKRDPFAE